MKRLIHHGETDWKKENPINQEGENTRIGPYKLVDNSSTQIDGNLVTTIVSSKQNTNTISNTTTNSVEVLTNDEVKEIKLIQEEDNKNFNDLNNLDIFKNVEYVETKLIYPGLSGVYNFNIENNTSKNIYYKLSSIIYNPHNVNMKYKLKRNGNYIVGSNDSYVNSSELTKEQLYLGAKTGDVYTLYWKWEDTQNDVQSSNPISRGDYTLTLKGEV